MSISETPSSSLDSDQRNENFVKMEFEPLISLKKQRVGMWLSRQAGLIGRAIARSPLLVTLLSIIIFSASCVLLYVLPKNIVLSFDEGYTTSDAPSIREMKAYTNFFGNLGKPWYMGLFAEPRNGSMIDRAEFSEFRTFYNHIKTDLILREVNGTRYNYRDYCTPTCDINEILFKTYEMSFFGMSWPVTTILWVYESNIGKHFFNRVMKGEDIISSQLEGLYFAAFINSTDADEDLQRFEKLVARAVEAHNTDPTKKTILTQHSQVVMETAIRQGMQSVTSYMLIGAIVFLIFTVISLLYSARVHSQLSGKSLLIIPPSILLPVFSLTTAAATHALFGNHFNAVMLFAPFIALGFGIDGILLLYNQWLRSQKKRIYDENEGQLQEVLAETMPSLVITTLSSIILIVGVIYPITEYAQFSLFIGLTILWSFFYQIFFFTPIMVMIVPSRRHESLKELKTFETKTKRRFIDSYSALITRSNFFKFSVIAVFILALVIPSAIGLKKIRGNLDYRHLLHPEAKANKGVHIMGDVVWPDILQIMFYIEKPPKFEDSAQYKQFNELVDDIQKIDGAMRMKDNMMFVKDFKKFANTPSDATSLDMTKFYAFITDELYQAWNSGVKYRTHFDSTTNTTSVEITNMLYLVAFNGTRSLADKATLLSKCREVASRYTQFQVIPFDTEVGMADVVTQAPEATIIIPIACLVSLFVWFLFFAANLTSSLIAAFSASAVFFCSYGLCSLMGATINPFSIGALVSLAPLSIKAVVPFAYFFQLSSTMQKNDNVQRIRNSMAKALLPTVLSSICSSALLLPVLFVPIRLFSCLSMLSFIHFLISLLIQCLILPILFSIVPRVLTGTGCLYTANDAF
ncbi:unnamed protein product, partial [Mesorhabditis belari]|uniref:SSD domain-containing protein n=1 Tax=Mesorhabditis belari TaxID=2138241 RepID=A0AAF3EZ34_9BILA